MFESTLTEQEFFRLFKHTKCEDCPFQDECCRLLETTDRRGKAIDLCDMLLENKYENQIDMAGAPKEIIAHLDDGHIEKTLYYPLNGKMSMRITYNKERELDGMCEMWYSNGQLSARSQYKNGKRVGLSQGWYPNGSLCYQIHYGYNPPISKYYSWDSNTPGNKPFMIILK